MSFVYPQFLWAFFFLAIPIIVHLFNFRRYKTVYFSRVKFLKEVTEDSKSGAKLKHLMVLLARLLALSALILAFAQPFIPAAEGEMTENISSIYIDNSFSMEAQGQDGDLLNEAKNRAIELVKSFEENEKINLLTSDLLSIHHRFYTRDEVITMIKEIELTPKTTQLKNVLTVQTELLNNSEVEGNKRIFLFSDFQKDLSSLDDFKLDEIATYYYQPRPEQSGNVFIDSVWFETPVHRLNSPVDVFFRVRNMTDNTLNDLSISLSINDADPAPKRISVEANSFTEDKITFTDRKAGTKRGKLSILTNQLFFDDDFYFTYDIKESVEILIVKETDNDAINLEQLYSLEPYYNAESVSIDQLTQEQAKAHEFIVLQNIDRIPSGVMDLLDDALRNGASVCIIPGTDIDYQSWNGYLGKHQLPEFTRSDSVDVSLSIFHSEDPIYQGVFESSPKNYKHPMVFKHYQPITGGKGNYMSLFETGTGEPYLYYSNQLNGKLIVMTSPINGLFTNFQNHALFAATFLRFAETASFQKPLYLTIGKEGNYPLNEEIDETHPLHLVNSEFGTDVLPQIMNTKSARYVSFNHLEDNLKSSGFYELTDNNKYSSMVALNYDRTESNMTLLNPEELKQGFIAAGWSNTNPLEISETGMIEINKIKATEYWRILLIFALIFFAAEISLLKLWKT